MSQNRFADYLEHIQKSATDACSFVEGMAAPGVLYRVI